MGPAVGRAARLEGVRHAVADDSRIVLPWTMPEIQGIGIGPT